MISLSIQSPLSVDELIHAVVTNIALNATAESARHWRPSIATLRCAVLWLWVASPSVWFLILSILVVLFFDNNLMCLISHLLYIHVRTREKNTIQTDDLGLFALYFNVFFFRAHFQCTFFRCLGFHSEKKQKASHKIIRRQNGEIKIGTRTHSRSRTASAYTRSMHVPRAVIVIKAQLFRYYFFFGANLWLDVVKNKKLKEACGCIY